MTTGIKSGRRQKNLKNFPNDPFFENSKLWGPAKSKSGELIKDLYKLKWHNLGSGKVQLRQLVYILNDKAYLLKAYIKSSPNIDFRQMALAKTHMDLIKEGRVKILGEL